MSKNAMHALSYGLFVVTARRGDFDNGCITNTAVQVTSEPSRISLAVNNANLTCEMIKESGRFAVSVLSEEAEFETFRRFGFQSGRNTDKFKGYEHTKRLESGILIVTAGTNAYMEAEVENALDIGSHTLFIAKVVESDVLSDCPSATYEYYQRNIKPKRESKPEESENEKNGIYRCEICGYEYDPAKGDPERGIAPDTAFEELPSDWTCPICKHPKSDFAGAA